jgi:hypothetical protein
VLVIDIKGDAGKRDGAVPEEKADVGLCVVGDEGVGLGELG